jgi:general stress protein 26
MQTTVKQLEPAQKEKITKFLQLHRVGVLATVDANGDPHGSTIYVNVDDNLSITFTTKRETQKFKNIAGHNKIMIVTCDAAAQAAVQISGKAVEVHD